MVRYCPDCGSEIEENNRFCKSCGEELLPQKTDKIEKPVVIVIAAILFCIMGIFEVLSGLIIAAVGPIVGTELSSIIGGFAIVFGGIFVVAGVLDIAAAYGLWELKKWGGILGIILCIIGLLLSLPFVAIDYGFSVILNLVMIILIAMGWNSLE